MERISINKMGYKTESLSLYASAQGKTEILDYMLKNRRNQISKIVNRFGGNALIPAAEKGHLENVKLLLQMTE